MSPYRLRLLTRRSISFCFAKLLDESQRLPLKTPLKPSPSASRKKLDELVGPHVKELVQIDTS
ncbi:hypothetical protein T12_1993, partial [Trichinella patagoniensis]